MRTFYCERIWIDGITKAQHCNKLLNSWDLKINYKNNYLNLSLLSRPMVFIWPNLKNEGDFGVFVQTKYDKFTGSYYKSRDQVYLPLN